MFETYPGPRIEDGIVTFVPGPIDVHAHPRVGDALTDIPLGLWSIDQKEGKAGLVAYTETALASGIVAIHAMPNEFIRVSSPGFGAGSEIVPFPISNRDRALFMESAISTQSRIEASYYLGLDPAEITVGENGTQLDYRKIDFNFATAGERTKGLKIYGAETTGGNNVRTESIPSVAELWYSRYPDKPVIMHLEDGGVRNVLEDMYENSQFGKEIPIHIAHVSSQQELEAVMWAKELGLNVTCEVTPHHLFTTGDARDSVKNYGLVKPSLKEQKDVDFLWENMDCIDIFASDCAPHKVSDKEGGDPVWGIANHTVMLPLLFGAAEEGRLTMEELYRKIVVNPRERFNLQPVDRTEAAFNLTITPESVAEIEADINPEYGQNVFLKLEEIGQHFHLAGALEHARSGRSKVERRAGRLVLAHKTELNHLVT